jgi:hypothetical protein
MQRTQNNENPFCQVTAKTKGFLPTNDILTHHLKTKKLKKLDCCWNTGSGPRWEPPYPNPHHHSQAGRRRHRPDQTTTVLDHAATDRVETHSLGQANPNPSDVGLDASSNAQVGKRHQCPCRTTPSRSETATVRVGRRRHNQAKPDGEWRPDRRVGPKATPRFGPTPDPGGGCAAAPWTGGSRVATPQWSGVAAQSLGWPSGQP